MVDGGIKQWFTYIENSDKILREQGLKSLNFEEKNTIAKKLEEKLVESMKWGLNTDKDKVASLGIVLPGILKTELTKIRTVDWDKYYGSRTTDSEEI